MSVGIKIKQKGYTNKEAFFLYEVSKTIGIHGIVKRVTNNKSVTYLVTPRYMNTVKKAYWVDNWKEISDNIINRSIMFNVFK
jgi:hypothetical protein